MKQQIYNTALYLRLSRDDEFDIVNISWHIFLKDITDYAAISKAS